MTVKLLTPKTTYTVDYPQAIELTEMQEDIFWTSREVEVEKDLQNIHHDLTEAELHGVTTVLKLFTLYELHVGNEYWLDYVRQKFQRPEIQRMASVFGMMELNVHAPFYDKLNDVMGLKTDEFYSSYVDDPILKERMDWLEEQFKVDDPLLVTAIGSIVEGAILYSNFAFLKHFASEGKNLLTNVTTGINSSVRDENLHSLAGAWLHRALKDEVIAEQGAAEIGNYLAGLDENVYQVCDKVLEHESRIADMIFEKGDITGITALQLKNFIAGRLDLCLEQLGLEPQYKPKHDPIKKWFYKNINSGQLHDFFHKNNMDYVRSWKETAFVWNPSTA